MYGSSLRKEVQPRGKMMSVLVRVVGSHGESRSWTNEEAMVRAMVNRCMRLRLSVGKRSPSMMSWSVMGVYCWVGGWL